MRRATVLAAGLLFTLGCGKEALVKLPEYGGAVDTTLSPEQQQRQKALIRLFTALQSGTSIEHVKNYEPDLDFNESTESFLQEGIQLRRWDWAGPPENDKLRVHMEFLLDEPPGDKTVSYDRTYQVTIEGGRLIIRRAD